MTSQPTIGELLRNRNGTFTPAERKVARLLLADYPLSGLQPVAQLAARAGVSAPSVLRLVGKLGFASYPDFQLTLKAELTERLSSPLAMYASYPSEPTQDASGKDARQGAAGVLERAAGVFEHGIRSSLCGLPAGELDAAVAVLTDARRPVTLTGGRFSGMLAAYLAAHLRQFRPHVRHVADSPDERAAALLDISRRDAVVIFDYRRYQHDTIRFGQAAAAQGADIVLFTDPWLSPLANCAEVVLPASVAAPSPYDSLVPALALVEALVAALVERLGEAPRSRIARYDSLTRTVTQGVDVSGEELR